MEQNSSLAVDQANKDRLHPESYDVYEKIMRRMPFIQTDPLYLIVHGQAGSGKTELLKAIRDGVNVRFGDKNACIVTAPTAQGASLVGARTINSTFLLPWNTITLKDFLEVDDSQKLESMMWMRESKILLIDIVNCLNVICFHSISNRLQRIFGNNKPFGGISVMVFGDFYQLPPVEGNCIFEGLPFHYLEKQRQVLPGCVENLWSLFTVIELMINKKVLSENQQDVLTAMRFGTRSDYLWDYLNENCKEDWDKNQNPYTIVTLLGKLKKTHKDKTFIVLGWTREVVNTINELAVEREDGEKIEAIRAGAEFKKPGNFEDMDLVIAKGSPVISMTNDESGITNGSFGTVKHWDHDTVYVKFASDIVPISRVSWIDKKKGVSWRQFPLRLAYASTIQQSQGLSFDGAIILRNNNWEEVKGGNWNELEHMHDEIGSLYTFFSRVRNLGLCRVFPIRFLNWRVSRKAEEELQRLKASCRATL